MADDKKDTGRGKEKPELLPELLREQTREDSVKGISPVAPMLDQERPTPPKGDKKGGDG